MGNTNSKSVATEAQPQENSDISLENNEKDDGYEFHFRLDEDGQALNSVAVVDGIPEFHFVASPSVPCITQEDVAVIFRLVSEDKRPEFYFYGFPEGHPFAGRQYKGYHPPWLRETSIGDLLFEADWKMKCLHVGARTDDKMSTFYSWKDRSNLEGLATWPDFPKDAKPIGCSIIMSCESVKVQREENSLDFVEEPKVTITDQTNSLYSKYISEILPNIAYHDEPLFLKMQELSKLILACEWLKEKGVTISPKWISDCTNKPRVSSAASANRGIQGASEAKKPPYEMIPKPTTVQRPSNDVTVMTWEAEQYRCLSECGVRHCYGYCDGGELKLFTEHGTPLRQEKFIRSLVHRSVRVGKDKVTKTNVTVNIPPSVIFALAPSVLASGEDSDETDLPPNFSEEVIGSLGPMTLSVSTDEIPTNDGVQFEFTTTLQLCPTMIDMEETIVLKVSQGNYDMLYGSYAPPNIPIGMDSNGALVVPDVETWSELYSESVPWPQSFQIPYTGVGEPAPSGGVSTCNLSATEVPTRSRRETTRSESRSEWKGQYRRNGERLVVQAMRRVTNGTVHLVNTFTEKFAEVSSKFTHAWLKGICPRVEQVFEITNSVLKQKWESYKQRLGNKTVEEHFHGTWLTCDITSSKQLCQFAHCGICGISCCGLDPNCIQKNIAFQRFGSGFYLAPHSSKCHDYTEGTNGFRAMILCDVLPGKKYQLTKTNQTLQGAPYGFNSVYGQVGKDLNYPEIVLYQSEAVMPRYIILYRKDGTGHPLAKQPVS